MRRSNQLLDTFVSHPIFSKAKDLIFEMPYSGATSKCFKKIKSDWRARMFQLVLPSQLLP